MPAAYLPGPHGPSVISFAAAGGNDAATTAWVNAVVADGGSVSGTQTTRVNTLIVGLKADSLFTILDRLWLYAGESDAHQAKIDIINLGTHTLNGTPTLAAGGYTGNGTSQYIATGFNPATAGGHYVQDSAALGAYVRTNNAAYDSGVFIGASDGSNSAHLYLAQNSGAAFCKVNTTTFTSCVITTQQGMWVSTRTASNAQAVYRNGNTTAIGSDSNVSSGNVNKELYALAFNNNGSAGLWVPDQVSAILIGGALTATQASNLASRINAYMTSWGINVY